MNISETVRDRLGMAYGLSKGHVTDYVT